MEEIVEVQLQLDELREIKSVVDGDPKSLDKFADIIERTVVVLKENGLHADLSGSTLYGMVVEKLLENLLKQYYRWVREKGKHESNETLNEWVAEEADFQMQNGFTTKRKTHRNRTATSGAVKMQGGSLTNYSKQTNKMEIKIQAMKVGEKKSHVEHVEKSTVVASVKSLKDGQKRNDERQPNSLNYVFGV